MITCSNCNRQHEDTVKICDFCGHPLSDESNTTHVFDNTEYGDGHAKWGTARFRDRLIVSERESKNKYSFDFEDFEQLILGRKDPDTGELPDIDLTLYHAAEKGVSRRHATIIRRETALNVVDLGTPNGTFLNGQRLVANQPRILRDGDEVRLGHLVLRITFAHD